MNPATHPTRALIDLDHLAHNLRLLQQRVGARPLWPAVKANAYGHGAAVVAARLAALGYRTLCVAHVAEALALVEAGVGARFVILSASTPDDAETIVAAGFEPVVCSLEALEALARAASRLERPVKVHLKVDTGMGRIGAAPGDVPAMLERCRELPGVRVKGLMSHFARADERDKAPSHEQLRRFREVVELTAGHAIGVQHMANSAAIIDLPESHLDAARPGIAMYGLAPSTTMRGPLVEALRPVLTWQSRITFLKRVPAGTGLSYGHSYRTAAPALIATIPVGYGDGLSRLLSNRAQFLVAGRRCRLVGRVTMDQCLLDVTALGGQVQPGDRVTLIGRDGDEEVTADELADLIGTIAYEVVTAISARVPRLAVESQASTR